MSDPTNERISISSDAMASPVLEPQTEQEDFELQNNTVLEEEADNDSHCHENIEKSAVIEHSGGVKYKTETSQQKMFKEVYKAISEGLECEPEEKEELLFNLKVDIGKRIYKGKPPMPKEEYLGKWKSGNPVEWFIDKYQDVLLFSVPKYEPAQLYKDDKKIHRAIHDMFRLNTKEIQELHTNGVFKKIGIFTDFPPKTLNELFGKDAKVKSHVQDYKISVSSSKSNRERPY